MYKREERPKENKSRAVANSVDWSEKGIQQGVVFVDNRDAVVAQRKNIFVKQSNSRFGESPIQRKIEKDSQDKKYTLIIDDDKFLHESINIFNYLESKNLLERFLNKEIHIQKADGTKGKVCHHWAFGGLSNNFNLNIEQIHAAFGGTREESEFGPEIPGPLNWVNLGNTNGLDRYGSTKYSRIKVYEQGAHSSRLLSGGMWWHKFDQNEFIFGIKGGDNNLIYSAFNEIRVKALESNVNGSKSKFSYVKKWETPSSKNRYDQTNALLGRKNLDRNSGTLQEKAKDSEENEHSNPLYLNKETIQKMKFGKAERFQETFTTKTGLTGSVLNGGILGKYGIQTLSDLEHWLNSKKSEMNNVVKNHYASLDEANREFGIESKTNDGKRTGLCGITCEALLDWFGKNYPLIRTIAEKHSYLNGEHYALKFNFPGNGSIVVDPTYRQFDKTNKYKNKGQIWVGAPNDHPFYG